MRKTQELCEACTHAEAREINLALARGVPTARVAREFGLRPGTVNRHARLHVPKLLELIEEGKKKQMAEEIRVEQIESLKDLIFEGHVIRKKLWQLLDQAERTGDIRAAIGAADRLGASLDRIAHYLGLDNPQDQPQSREQLEQVIRDLYGLTPQEMPQLPGKGDRVLQAEIVGAEIVKQPPDAKREPEPKEAEPRAAEPSAASDTVVESKAEALRKRLREEILLEFENRGCARPTDDRLDREVARRLAALPQPKPTPIENAATPPETMRRFVAERQELERIHREGRRAEVGELSKLVN